MPRYTVRLTFCYETTVSVDAPSAEAVANDPSAYIDFADLDVDTVEDLTMNPIDWNVAAVEPASGDTP